MNGSLFQIVKPEGFSGHNYHSKKFGVFGFFCEVGWLVCLFFSRALIYILLPSYGSLRAIWCSEHSSVNTVNVLYYEYFFFF